MVAPKKKPQEGHRKRLRDKFMEHGIDKLTNAEILELLLSFGTPRKDCKLTARAMLEKFGTLRDVFEANDSLLSKIEGAGPANIVAIKFVHAVAGKFLEKRLVGRSYLSSSSHVLEYLRHSMESLEKEVFKVIYLDNNNAVICLENLSHGSIAEAHVHPREVLERAIALKSSCMVFVHNHPSGKVTPSEGDLKLTRRLVHLAYLGEMLVLDHIIIGKEGDFFSFKDNGLIILYEQEIRESYRLAPRPSGGLLHESNPVIYGTFLSKKNKKRTIEPN
ncbi:MAG: RadC family protein [Candidatus Adiutrix sp.]